MKISTNFFWILIFLVAISGAWLCMDEGHEFGDDFILYIDQAERFWDAANYRWLENENRFCMENSDKLIGPYLYPRGFPFFLSTFIGLKSAVGWIGIKMMHFLFFSLAVILFLNSIIKEKILGMTPSLLLGVLIMWNPKILEAADRLQSDLFFTSLILIFWAVWWNTRLHYLVKWGLLGLLVFGATLTKTNGILLIVPLLVQPSFYVAKHWLNWKFFQSFSNRQMQGKDGENLASSNSLSRNSWVGVLFSISLGFWALWLERKTGANHWEELLENHWGETIVNNFTQYWGMLSALPLWYLTNVFKLLVSSVGLSAWVAWSPFVLLTLWIAIFTLKRLTQVNVELLVFVLANLFILTVWPSQQGVRMLFPIYPVWMLLAVQWLKIISVNRPISHIRLLGNARVLAFGFAVLFLQMVTTGTYYKKLDTNRAFSSEMLELSEFIKGEIPDSGVISFFKPRLLRYTTGKRVLRIENNVNYSKPTLQLEADVHLNMLKGKGVDYFVAPRWDYDQLTVANASNQRKLNKNTQPKLLELAHCFPIFKNNQFVILRLLRKG